MTTIQKKKMQEHKNNFYCEKCDFQSSNKYNYDKHLRTSKHRDTTFCKKYTTILPEPKSSPRQQHSAYKCECGKEYPYRASLYNHKKKCKFVKEDTQSGDIYKKINEINKKRENKKIDKEENDESTEMILKLVEENGEIRSLLYKQFETMQMQMQEQQRIMHNQISELIPRVGNNNTVNKQKLNINIFLNEQCKDALTMEQFIKKIQVTIGDLLVTKDKGLSEGVSNIFIENMNKLSLYERPLHCTDVKREIVYIKSEDIQNDGISQWEKDDENIKLKQILKQVTCMQQQSLDKWIEEHPNWQGNPAEQEEYMLLVKNCTDEFSDKENKIIKKLCTQTRVDVIDS